MAACSAIAGILVAAAWGNHRPVRSFDFGAVVLGSVDDYSAFHSPREQVGSIVVFMAQGAAEEEGAEPL